MPTTLGEQEAQLDQLIKSGQNDAAIKLLYQMALTCAENKDFEQAEVFRDQLYEVDSMALKEILQVNEAIETEKSKLFTSDHRRQWASFYESLSKEEANAFFIALKEKMLDDAQVVFQQGDANECLYLVHQGKLKVTHERSEKQMLIHTLGPGDIFGEDTFFSINVCTVSIEALSKVKLSYLQRDQLEGLTIQFPHLEEKLKDICGTGEKIFNWLKQKGMDRREFKRYIFQTKAWFQLLNTGNPNGISNSIAADIWDVSRSGLCFYFHSIDREFVRNLVGRTLGVNIIFKVSRRLKDLSLTGVVQGVQNHPMNEYSVHLKLRQNLSEKAMANIIRLSEEQHTLT
jgi:CRP-like cAMP-binding protein